MLTQLDLIREENFKCKKCDIRKFCKNVVVGRGNVNGRFMFVGDHPGDLEDKWGRPFMGRTGYILDKLLEGARLDRGDVYLTYMIKCGAVDYEKEHERNCRDWLVQEIKEIKPLVIFLFGNKCSKFILEHKGVLSKIERKPRVKYFDDFSTTVVPLISIDRISKSGLIPEYSNVIKTYTRGL